MSNRRHPGPGAPEKARPQRGFVLLETLVAIAVLGLGLALAWQLYATLGRSQAQAADRVALLTQARDIMEGWLAQPQVQPGLSQGQEGKTRWEVRVADITPPPPASREKDLDAADKLPRLLSVEVCCRLRPPASGRPVCLRSARLAPAPEQARVQE